jgi:hypothetical protein
MMTEVQGRRRRRFLRVLGRALAVLGVIVSWAWSTELSIAGRSAAESISGTCTFVLLACGTALLYRTRTLPGRPARVAYLVVVGACAAAALTAATAPSIVTRTSTGTVNTTITPAASSSRFRLSGAANITSDTYHRTNLSITVHADDRTAPLLQATVSFTDGTVDLSCANTRQTWIHEVSTITLGCDDFTPVSSLRSIAAIMITEE